MSDTAQLQRQLTMMQEKMTLMEEAHLEEKNELSQMIVKLESEKGMAVQSEKGGDGLETRVGQLEGLIQSLLDSRGTPTEEQLVGLGGARHISGESEEAAEEEQSSKEQSLSLTFGDVDTLPSSLERFISHYGLVNEINTARGVKVWKKPSYRALILRMALRGPAADYIEQESRLLSQWVKDDMQIIEKLKARYIQNSAVELHIINFEKAEQGEGEPLSDYMVRLQRLVLNAFPDYPEWVNQNKVVWQFLNGARDKDVREALIREGWMLDSKTAKSYEVVLKTAEQVVNTRKAAKATGRIGQASGSTTSSSAVSAVSGAPPNKKRRSSGQGKTQVRPKQTPSWGSGTGNFFCVCCRTTDHYGGWKECPKFKAEHPP